jgi:SAM-dependent methyltransferase
LRLDDPGLVAEEYASESGLLARRALYDDREGPDPRDTLWDVIVAAAPQRVLEVGQGPGELSERIQRELGAEVVAIDVSERMVELARARGVDARVADVQELPFADDHFDLVVAAWVLFHVPDLDRGLAEVARVLRPGGRFAAVTNSEHHLGEARSLAGFSMVGRVPFSRENGEQVLGRHFAQVERIDVDGWVVFPDTEAVRAYLRTLVLGKQAAEQVPERVGELTEPLRATTRNTIFVATIGHDRRRAD